MKHKRTIKTARQVAHIRLNSGEHIEDKAENLRRIRVDYVACAALPGEDMPLIKGTVEGLEKGLYWDDEMNEVSGEEQEKRLNKVLKEDNYYIKRENKTKGGEPTGAWVNRTIYREAGFEKVVYTYPPWVGNVLKKNKINDKAFYAKHVKLAKDTYEDVTGFNVKGCALHSEDIYHNELYALPIGKGQFTTTKGKTYEDNKLLCNKYNGNTNTKHTYENMGYGAIAILRYHSGAKGEVFPVKVIKEIYDEVKANRESNGCECPDLAIAVAVDNQVYHDLAKMGLSRDVSYEFEKWKTWEKDKFNNTPAGRIAVAESELAKANAKLEHIKKYTGIRCPEGVDIAAFCSYTAKGLGIENKAGWQNSITALALYEDLPEPVGFIKEWEGMKLGKYEYDLEDFMRNLGNLRHRFRGVGMKGIKTPYEAKQELEKHIKTYMAIGGKEITVKRWEAVMSTQEVKTAIQEVAEEIVPEKETVVEPEVKIEVAETMKPVVERVKPGTKLKTVSVGFDL